MLVLILIQPQSLMALTKQGNGEEYRRLTRRWIILVWLLLLPLTSHVTLAKEFNPSMPQSPHLQNGANNSTYILRLLWRLNELIHVKFKDAPSM